MVEKGRRPAVRKFAIGFVATSILLVTACEIEESVENPVESNVVTAGTVVRLTTSMNVLVPIDATVDSDSTTK